MALFEDEGMKYVRAKRIHKYAYAGDPVYDRRVGGLFVWPVHHEGKEN